MTTTKFCTIRILTKSYHIKCPEAEMDNLTLAAKRLNDELLNKKGTSKKLDDYQTLLMAALHISHELVVCEGQQSQQRQQLAQFINTLENTIGIVEEVEDSIENVDAVPELTPVTRTKRVVNKVV